MSGSKPKRTPAQQVMRYAFGTIMIGAIIFVLSQIPYEILREERFRMYGETSVVGVVTAVFRQEESSSQYAVQYQYVDQDGLSRHATAPLPKDIWSQYRAGSRLRVTYAVASPSLARIKGEIEPPFQLWLRSMLD